MTAIAETLPFRPTPQRTAILEVVVTSHDHPTARDIYRRVRELRPSIGFATVYRTLDLLVDHGAIRHLQFGEEAVARYDGELRRHDHIRCEACGRVDDITVDLPARVVVGLADTADTAGYDLDGYDLVLRGVCAACAAG